jgi:N6-L-threonylcarbamoyladenine synthase
VRYSQIKTHAKYGGVVPEVAAREHTVTIIPTLHAALKKAHLKITDINLITVTEGPGLSPALAVGIDTARILSRLHRIPIVGIQHIEGHMLSVWPIKCISAAANRQPKLPLLSLVVSGGHTQLVLIKKVGSYIVLGKTRDDAAGEAFDKVATLLGLPYPGGPEISKLARKGKRDAIAFPRPMMNEHNFDFSFSGLKTAVRYYVDAHKKISRTEQQHIAASFEQAVVDVLVHKTLLAAKKFSPASIALVGGVSANTYLRTSLRQACKTIKKSLYLAPPTLTQDNATMIAMVAALKKTRGSLTAYKTLEPKPTWEIG